MHEVERVKEYDLNREGIDFVLREGDEVEIDCVAGLCVNATGKIVGITLAVPWGCPGPAKYLGAVGIDLDPNEKLRELCARYKEMASKLPPLPSPYPKDWTPAPSGLDGNGGLVVFTEDGIKHAIQSGQLRVKRK